MSKFRVNLNQGGQGNLDVAKAFLGFSPQRTISLDGPNGVNRHLNDGQIFEDSNYFKQYCQPYCSAEDAVLELLEDDGSVYDKNNKFPVIFRRVVDAHSNCSPKCEINAEKHCKGKIHSTQIVNRSESNSLLIKFNRKDNAVLELLPGEAQTFNQEDFSISHIDFINESKENIKVQVLMSVTSQSST